ncbi:MAG TPA: hypothetical protein DF698_10520 [Candidatus Atribacteria bacterium]|nr:hypothetical protein [Candidatus Atribacteria bacterium]
MKFGIHPYIWIAQWNESSLPLISQARQAGFDFIEIPLVDLEYIDSHAILQGLKNEGIFCICSTGLNLTTDITSEDKGIRQNGIDFLKRCIDLTAEMEARFFSGVTYSAFGKNVGRPPCLDEWKYSADALREAALYAAERSVIIGIEPVNRYETYLINTGEQAHQLIEMVGEPNLKVHLDTYHMNIEEKDFYQPIFQLGNLLGCIHLCENDRGIPGTGLVRWDDIFRALRDINYQGNVAIESFVANVPKIAAATCIWRSLAPDGDTLAREGLAFLKSIAQKEGL